MSPQFCYLKIRILFFFSPLKSFKAIAQQRQSYNQALVINNFGREISHDSITVEIFMFEFPYVFFFFFANCWKQIKLGILAGSSCNRKQIWRSIHSLWGSASLSIYINLPDKQEERCIHVFSSFVCFLQFPPHSVFLSENLGLNPVSVTFQGMSDKPSSHSLSPCFQLFVCEVRVWIRQSLKSHPALKLCFYEMLFLDGQLGNK